jgi:hypothetical protein
MKKTSLKSCFIIAPATVNISSLIRLLEIRGIKVGNSINDSFYNIFSKFIENEIYNSDFVLVVLSSKSSYNVFYEIGLARGAKKPAFAIIEEKEIIFPDLQDIFYIRASIENQEAIEFALDQFLLQYQQHKYDYNTVRKKSEIEHKESKIIDELVECEIAPKESKIEYIESGQSYSKNFIPFLKVEPKKKLDTELYQKLLESIDRGSNRFGVEIESFVARLFENLSDITIVKKEPIYADRGADISLWIESPHSNISNPVLVQVKSGRLSDSILKTSENQLSQYLKKTNAPIGLLIYFDFEKRNFQQPSIETPLVIWLELSSLVSMLSQHSLAQIIVTQRNLIMHSINEV